MTGAAQLMAGKCGVVMGVANDHSIAWGIARTLSAHGAKLAFTYQDPHLQRRVLPLAEQADSSLAVTCDVNDQASIDAAFARIGDEWGRLDFLVHAIAHSDKSELTGPYLATSRANFARTLEISCYSFTATARAAAGLMDRGGSMLTLTYEGARRTMPNYNVMGVAKAALEASVRYLAVDLGNDGIRVNALSPGPMRTISGAAIANARFVHKWQGENAPLRRNATLEDVGGAALFLLSDLGCGTTGEIVHVDGGYHVVGMAMPPL